MKVNGDSALVAAPGRGPVPQIELRITIVVVLTIVVAAIGSTGAGNWCDVVLRGDRLGHPPSAHRTCPSALEPLLE